MVERLLGKLNAVIGRHDGDTGRSIEHRDGYPSEKRACLTFADLERCVALAIIDHNGQMNEKTLKVPVEEWSANVAGLPQTVDAPEAVLLNFLPEERRLATQSAASPRARSRVPVNHTITAGARTFLSASYAR